MLKDNKLNILVCIIFSVFLFSTFPAPTHAQSLQTIVNGAQNDIQISSIPQFPKTGDTVSVNLKSYGTPLDQANITWIIGGKTQSKGLGLTSFSVIAGGIGKITTVTARITTVNGAVVNKTISIQPTDIDLLWQVSSYTPPFYQGKALYPHQGLITFTAIPNISASKSLTKTISSYIYTWKKDGAVLGDFSGYGKNTFRLRGTIISRPFVIEVSVSSPDGTPLGSASVITSPIAPTVTLYENHPLLGVLYNKSISNYTMTGKELSIEAVPFFFNNSTEMNSLKYNWTMNGNKIDSQNDPSVLTVRNTANATGNATVGLRIDNALKTLQSASNSLNITFGQDKQSNI